jgi:integrase
MDWDEKDVKTWKRKDAGGVYYVRIPGRVGWSSSGETTKRKAVEWALDQAHGGIHPGMSLQEYARNFFIPGKCPFIRLREESEGKRQPKTWRTYRQLLADYILPTWGHFIIPAIRPRPVFDWLSKIKSIKKKHRFLSPAQRKKLLLTFVLVFDQAVFDGAIELNSLRTIPKLSANSKPRRIFLKSELVKMFPESESELIEIWGSLKWAVFFLIIYETGLRPQEVVALMIEKYHPQLGGFAVVGAVDDKAELKGLKTEGRGVKVKAALITKRTEGLLLKLKPPGSKGLVFIARDRGPHRVSAVGQKFCRVLDRIDADGNPFIRRFGRTLYSLRHNFNTAVRTALSDDAGLRDLMGHTTRESTERYDHPEELEVLLRVQDKRAELEKLWSVSSEDDHSPNESS